MKFEFKPSFEKSLKNFYPAEKEEITRVTSRTIDILSGSKSIYKGIGLKRLRNNYWEVRKGLKSRILFRWQGDLVEFVLAGDHKDIRRYLKNI